MDAEEGYKPPSDFQEDIRGPLVGISSTDSTEFWLIQWPLNQFQPDDFQGRELKFKLKSDGKLANYVSSSGKSYEFVSSSVQQPDACVFLASATESKIVGKISRHVSLVSYPELKELEKPVVSKQQNNLISGGSTLTSRDQSTTSGKKSWRMRSSGTISGVTSVSQHDTFVAPDRSMHRGSGSHNDAPLFASRKRRKRATST